MRFSEPMKMADGHGGSEHNPVWARTKRRSGGNPLIGLIVTLLALFGALTIALGVKERSVAEGGAIIDGWLSSGWHAAQRAVGKAPQTAEVAADKAGDAAEKAGDAVAAGAQKAADEIKTSQP
ncbi:hypothetical protein ASG17_01360 [Brevundimonas sp. Leaf363]|nr:hypothetical protein ASG17_01360 [Brevundimonas sp. Leaf363]